jgi:murein DD-endopeptidase MepM/ murein hydrolase activator NlpD
MIARVGVRPSTATGWRQPGLTAVTGGSGTMPPFGNNVQVQIGDHWIRYAHLEAVLVSDGDQVAPGTVLGLEGSTRFPTGRHLHFEVDRGCPAVACSIDPASLTALQGRGLTAPPAALNRRGPDYVLDYHGGAGHVEATVQPRV